MRFKLFLIMLTLILNSSALATNFYSGNQYKFSVNYNDNYIYIWGASCGVYQEIDKNTLSWIAPEVNSPTKITFSLSVTDKTCGCYSYLEKVITVLPLKEVKLETKYTSNSSNFTKINPPQINSTIINNTLLNPESETPSIINEPINLTLDALPRPGSQSLDSAQEDTATEESNSAIIDKNDSTNVATEGDALLAINENPFAATNPAKEVTDQSNQGAAAENPSGTEKQKGVADPNDQNAAEEACTLSFGDGIAVDVVFEQSNSLADTAYVMLPEAVKEAIGSASFPDGTNTPASLTNTTLVPESGIDQSNANTNQTKVENALPEIMAGSTGKTDVTLEKLNSLDAGSEAATASADPNENPSEQAINQTDIAIN